MASAWADLIGQAETLAGARRFDSAAALVSKALDVVTSARGTNDTVTARVLCRLGVYEHEAMAFAQADTALKRALAIREAALGPDHPDVAASLTALADLEMDLSRYDQAETLYRRSLAIRRKVFGSEDPAVAQGLNDLGVVLFRRGRYTESERLHRRALAMRRKLPGPNHLDVAQSLTNLSDVVNKQRRPQEAEGLCRQALIILERTPDTAPVDRAACITSLARSFRSQGCYDQADGLYRQALSILEEACDPNDIRIARLHNWLAALYVNIRMFDKAEDHASRARKIETAIFDDDNLDIAFTAFNYGGLLMFTGCFEDAVGEYKKSLAIRERILGPEHHDVARTLDFLAFCYYFYGDIDNALELSWRSIGIRKTNYIRNGGDLTDHDANRFNYTIHFTVSDFLTYYFNTAQDDPALMKRAADIVLSSKGNVFDDMFARHRFRVASTNPAVIRLGNRLRAIRAAKSRLYFQDPDLKEPGSEIAMDSLTGETRSVESSLGRYGERFRKWQLSRDLSSGDVAAGLPPGAVLVEYMWYVYNYPSVIDDERAHYLAVVIGRDGVRAIKDLGRGDASLLAIVRRYQDLMRNRAASSGVVGGQAAELDTLNVVLYRRLWAPIEKAVGNAALVFVSPDHYLNRIAFAALMGPDGHYLIERYPIQYLSAGRDVVRLANDSSRVNQGLFALGNPDFDATPAERLQPVLADSVWAAACDSNLYAVRNIRLHCEGLNELYVDPLPATAREVDRICADWRKNTAEPAMSFLGDAASEEAVKRIAPGNRVIHLATHGFFVPKACRRLDNGDLAGSETPFLHSGLLLAGSNLHGAGADQSGAEDGLLTAAEVSSLDLTGTELVVLSACESGLGDIGPGEGVFGLRRAFLLAGARTVICSLWPVSDAFTADLMEKIYRARNRNLAVIMRENALSRIAAARRAGRRPDPFYWAPFIAVGDWQLR